MINYAHGGASEYAPENTLSSFYLGLLQGANGIETDVQKTKDGVLVLFHDDELDRVSDHTGKLCDYTWEELQKVKIFGNCKNGFYDRIPTLREFLEKFSPYDIQFAIELKGPDVEKESLEMAKEFGILGNTTFTSFELSYIQKIKEMDPSARVGYLAEGLSDELTDKLLSFGCEEMAPEAETITPQWMEKWRSAGLGVRAWGVYNTDLMEQMCRIGVDGMTVNFPDKLCAYMKENHR